MTHIPSTASDNSDGLLAQKISTIIHAYGTDNKYTNKDINFLIEEAPNVRKVVVLLYHQDRVNGVLVFEHRFVAGQGVQGETTIHRPNGVLWEGLVDSLYPGARKIVMAKKQHHAH